MAIELLAETEHMNIQVKIVLQVSHVARIQHWDEVEMV